MTVPAASPALVVLALSAGCQPPEGPGDGADPTTGPDAATATDVGTDTDAGTDTPGTDTPAHTGDADTGAPWAVEVDCDALLPAPVEFVRYDWVPGSEDFTFSADGYLMQVTGGALKRTPYGGPPELVVPFPYDVRGTRFLPDGRLALATIETGSIVVLDPSTGGYEILASGLSNPNGMAIDPEGRIYVATTGRIMRVDPATGEQFVVADLPGNSFDGITFSPDYRRLFFNEELGQIHYVDLDAERNPVGQPRVGARIDLSPFSILDGMSMDACGNLYVAEMDGTVWRVRTDGTVEEAANLTGFSIIPALNFGYPVSGGWVDTALYVLTFTGSVFELQIGVPGKWEPHLR